MKRHRSASHLYYSGDALRYLVEGRPYETITECFPALTLEQVYGAIAYYLNHRGEIDAYLKASEQDYEAFRQRIRSRYPDLRRRLDDLVQPAETTRQ